MNSLLTPLDRKRLEQGWQPKPRWLSAIHDRLDYVWREQGQPKDAAHVASVDLLRRGDLADRRIPTRFEHPLPSERASERFHHRRIRARPSRRRAALPIGHHHRSAATPMPNDEWHAHGDAGQPRSCCGPASRWALGHKGQRPGSPSPSNRRRMSAPAGPISTRSTNNRTIRACSAGNSCSQSGSRLAASGRPESRPQSSPVSRSAPPTRCR